MAKRRWLGIAARIAEVMTIAVALGVLTLWCSIPNPAALASENPTSTAFIDLRRDQAAESGKPFTLQWRWQPLGRISRYLRAAIIYAEDHNFYRHDGVDWKALRKAVDTNLDAGNFAVGGSTITQQLARNLFLGPERSIHRKLREGLIARRLERALDKRRILELYLNAVEWGDGVWGAKQAARAYFGKHPSELGPLEATVLASLLPAPRAALQGTNLARARRVQRRVLHELRASGLIDRETFEAGRSWSPGQPMPATRRRLELGAVLASGCGLADEPAVTARSRLTRRARRGP